MPRDYSLLHNLHGVVPDSAISAFQVILGYIYDLNDQVQRMPQSPQKVLSIGEIETQIQARKRINVSQFLGVLAQPQPAAVPEVEALPDANDPLSQQGGVVRMDGILYVFDGDPEPGEWVELRASAIALVGIYSAIPAPGAVPAGQIYFASDILTEFINTGLVWVSTGGLYQILQNSATTSVTDLEIFQHLLNAPGLGAAGIGVGRLEQYPDDAGTVVDGVRLKSRLTDAGAATVTSAWTVMLRDAGAALADVFEVLVSGIRFQVGGFWAQLIHANTADRDYALIDYDGTVPLVVGSVALTAQVADITATLITGGDEGTQFVLAYTLLTTVADVTAGTIQLTIGYTDDAGATAQLSAVLPLAALGRDSGVLSIQRASSDITYAVALTAGAYGTAEYALYLTLERRL